jgi:class 3 adenylate cyclase/quercetin dioxygenase-like cupin family protein
MQQPRVLRKNFDDADEQLTFAMGSTSTVRIDELVVGRTEFQPGWKWSEQVKPVVGTDSCQLRHVGVAISGAGKVIMDDGTETIIRAGDVFDIPPGHDQWTIGDEPAVAIVWGGWRSFGRPITGDRILTTMLMTDIVGSTELASRIGDVAWDRLLEQHNESIREVLARYRATEIDTTGDGFLAIFDGAARAIHAAMEMRDVLGPLGLEIRAGIHTGEVEVVLANVRGVAVHEVARIMALAGAGEILVSSTTRELSSGANLSFTDRGVHELKGVPLPRQVFAVSEE